MCHLGENTILSLKKNCRTKSFQTIVNTVTIVQVMEIREQFLMQWHKLTLIEKWPQQAIREESLDV